MATMQFIKIVKPSSFVSIICRICLTTEGKFYRFFEFNLQSYYEELLGTKVSDSDRLPQYICMECATHLQKYHKFREKCVTSYNFLADMSSKGGVTTNAINHINRKDANLTSPISIMKLTDKVGVYFTQENDPGTINKIEYKPESKGVVKTEISTDNYEIDYIEELNEMNPMEAEQEITEILPIHTEIEIKQENLENTNTVVEEFENSENKPQHVEYRIIQNRKTRYLDANNWIKTTLNEDEAFAEFKMKCLDPTYMKSPYKCVDCFRGFSKEEMYHRHYVLRHNEDLGEHVCKLCKMRFKWQSHLRLHMKKHYNKYQCQRCNFVCSLEHTALAHEEYHSGVVKKCMHCSEEFRHISTYYTHIRNVHRSEYICTYCGASFVSEAGLHQHKKVKHFDADVYRQDSPDDDDEEVKTYCDRCDITFHTRKAYDEHKFHSVMHSEGIKDKKSDDATAPKKALGKRVRSVVNRQLQPSSQVGTTTAPTQIRRTRREKRPKAIPTTCHQCGEHFPTQTACMRHHLAEHPGTSFYPPTARYICDICGASLAPGSVAVHQNLHSREKKYPCPTCNKIFHSTVGLKRHLITHTGEKRYGCSLCEKRFTQSNSMKLHFRTFHLKQPYPKRNRDKKKKLLGRLHSHVVDIEECSRDEASTEELEAEVIEIPIEEHAVAVQYLNNYN